MANYRSGTWYLSGLSDRHPHHVLGCSPLGACVPDLVALGGEAEAVTVHVLPARVASIEYEGLSAVTVPRNHGHRVRHKPQLLVCHSRDSQQKCSHFIWLIGGCAGSTVTLWLGGRWGRGRNKSGMAVNSRRQYKLGNHRKHNPNITYLTKYYSSHLAIWLIWLWFRSLAINWVKYTWIWRDHVWQQLLRMYAFFSLFNFIQHFLGRSVNHLAGFSKSFC